MEMDSVRGKRNSHLEIENPPAAINDSKCLGCT